MSSIEVLGGKRLLWVEDDYYGIKALTWMIEAAGCEVEVAGSVVDARALIASERRYSGLILDLILPMSDREPFEGGGDPGSGIDQIIDNGVKLFEFAREEAGLELPILLLTVVEEEDMIRRLIRQSLGTIARSGSRRVCRPSAPAFSP